MFGKSIIFAAIRFFVVLCLAGYVFNAEPAESGHFLFKMRDGKTYRGEADLPKEGLSGSVKIKTKDAEVVIKAEDVAEVTQLPVPNIGPGFYTITIADGKEMDGKLVIKDGVPELRFGCLFLINSGKELEIPLDHIKNITKTGYADEEVESILKKEIKDNDKIKEKWNFTAEHTTKHFHILTTTDKERAEYIGELLEVLYSALSEFLGKDFGLFEPSAPMPVWLFSTKDEFEACRQAVCPDSVPKADVLRGVFDKKSLRFLVYEPKTDDGKKREHIEDYVLHEGTHQFINIIAGVRRGRDWLWLDEGLAMYFGNSLVEDGALKAGVYRPNTSIMKTFKEKGDAAFDYIDMMKAQSFFKGDADLNYARAWTFLHFLIENEEYRDKIIKVLKEVRECELSKKSFYRHFKPVLSDIIKDWKKHVEGLE